ncbi:MAG: FGGY-family carbohydrate kinase [Acidimicrobiales bacterium]
MGSLTVGLDIGTTSVKGVAVDDAGNIVARSRVPHRVIVREPDLLEHDADAAWRRGPRRALKLLGHLPVAAIAVSAMVPSLTAVDGRGRPISPGLLYGDRRGRTPAASRGPGADGEAVEFLRWTAAEAPGAFGYWSAPAVASRALGGDAVLDFGVAFTTAPLFGRDGWDPAICAACGVRPDQLPRVEMMGAPIGTIDGDGPLLATGSVDAMCEQLVAAADETGDIHVLCGTTLIAWAVLDQWREVDGLWTIPHTAPGRSLIGGASNAGGMFLSWVERAWGRPSARESVDPGNVPVWLPYLRGERSPYHEPALRAALHDLDLTHGPAAIRRAAWETPGFVVRHLVDRAGVRPRRIVATGGGTRVEGWMQGLADATNLPVHVAAVAEGAAQGAAFLARVAAGLETDMLDARRWARTARVVTPQSRWVEACESRYRRFRELSAAAVRDTQRYPDAGVSDRSR